MTKRMPATSRKITLELTLPQLRELRVAANVNVDSYELNEAENRQRLVIARRVYQLLLDAEEKADNGIRVIDANICPSCGSNVKPVSARTCSACGEGSPS